MAKRNSQKTADGFALDFEVQLWADGQESNYTTWKLARMNLAIRGIDANLGHEHADTFRNVQHLDLRADFVIANALRDSASNPAKPDAADGKRPTTTFFKN